jgi:2-oxo-4-hydroxy-4-carboxy-5-ureidoimidazoline decarboxylase
MGVAKSLHRTKSFMEQINLDTLNTADRKTFMAAIGEVMELAPWVAEETFAKRPFTSIAGLYQAMMDAVRHAPAERRQALIDGHPDLAGKAAREGKLTADSTAEQSAAGLDKLTDQEFADFHRLNDAYRKKFAMPFIVCVRRHGKQSILREFERRLKNDAAAEQKIALDEIFCIAALRLDQRVKADDRLKVHGHLSTHVLDVHAGHPAQGVAIELCEIAGSGGPRVIKRAVTNADGRTDAPLFTGMPVPIATYELRFSVADYFTEAGAPMAAPPFLDIVPVRFSIAEPEGRYHVPLLVTPWSYSTYRGS